MIKLLIGGSPCTNWSIAKGTGRETTPSGIGWELFKNYLIAKEKFKPDLFLYENNKSAAQPIKDQISKELGVDLMYINSALVSAQNRERFYGFNWECEQPKDRGILLKDILDDAIPWQEKAYCLTASYPGAVLWNTLERKQRTMVCRPIRIGTIEHSGNPKHDSRSYRVYSPEGKAVALLANGGGMGAKTGLYAVPVIYQRPHGYNKGGIKYDKAPTLTANGSYQHNNLVISQVTGKGSMPIYHVQNGLVTIKDKPLPIKLPDGYYIIRKLTVAECCRLQTMPDNYCDMVAKTNAYKGLGNGWTAEVIIHILNAALKDVPRDEPLTVLSMYDGIGTGRYCLDKIGFKNIRYYAYEIEKSAMQIASTNYPDIIQCGDAFQVR